MIYVAALLIGAAVGLTGAVIITTARRIMQTRRPS